MWYTDSKESYKMNGNDLCREYLNLPWFQHGNEFFFSDDPNQLKEYQRYINGFITIDEEDAPTRFPAICFGRASRTFQTRDHKLFVIELNDFLEDICIFTLSNRI